MTRTIESNLSDVERSLVAQGERARSYVVSMVNGATGGRSAAENAQILWIHWHGGRNKDKKRRPWFTSAAEWKQVQAAFQEALLSGEGSLRLAAEDVGRRTKGIYAKHVRTGKGKRGSIAPLSPGYKKWKDDKFPGKPVLVRTGQLLKSITAKVEQA